MIDRVNGPIINKDFDLTVKNLESSTLSNGIKVYELNNGTQDIVKIDIIFKSGRVNETKIAASKAAISLLREGSSSKNSQELAKLYDFYGCSVKLSAGIEYSSITLVCLTRYFDKIWPEWLNMVLEPAYSEDEIVKYKNVTSQRLKDQISKNEIISYRMITEKMFGSDHPYGYNTEPENIQSITKEDILNFYKNNCQFDNCFITLSGNYNDSIRKTILDDFSKIKHKSTPQLNVFPTPTFTNETLKIATKNEAQASIKLGCLWVERQHKDFNKLKFLNTVLGGYFGSRLMKNIREEKGYTYGIYSSFDGWDKGGSFYVSTDVSNEFIDPTLEEIYKEIEVLKNKPVDISEIDMVKNYILGQSLHLIDGPFATAQLIKSLYGTNQSIEGFYKNIREVKEITQNDILEMANKYLQKESFLTVLVGNM